MAGQFAGKVALVTGAGSGIGRASALAFARAGARVVVADIAVEGGEETVHQITNAGGEALFARVDVAQAAEVEALIDKVIEAYGRLDYAHNNAGIEGDGMGGLTHEYPEDTWDRLLAVNLKGVWLCMKYELPRMLRQGAGAIVNTASMAGLVGLPGNCAYAASKHAVVGLTRSAALESATSGVRINAVCPIYIRTPMIERVIAREGQELEARLSSLQPMGRMGTADEVAAAVIWLCSDAASFTTGLALPLDGGYNAR